MFALFLKLLVHCALAEAELSYYTTTSARRVYKVTIVNLKQKPQKRLLTVSPLARIGKTTTCENPRMDPHSNLQESFREENPPGTSHLLVVIGLIAKVCY